MNTRPTQREIEILARLAHSPDGQVLLAVLTRELEAVKSLLVDASPDVIPAMQGNARAYKELSLLLANAGRTASAMRDTEGRHLL